MTPTAERIVIAVFVAAVLIVAALAGVTAYQSAQPQPTPTPTPTPLTPVPTFAGYPVFESFEPGAAIVCYRQPLDSWRPLEYAAPRRRSSVWVRIEVNGGECYGWIDDPGS